MDSTPKSLEHKLAEAVRELASLRESLDICVAARKNALDAARTANEELQVFSYAVSHDLKEPLRSIASYAELLERHYADDKRTTEFTAFITDGVKRVNTLIENLLTY